MKAFGNFKDVIDWTSEKMHDTCYEVHTEKWQGKDIKQDDRFAMIEILNHSFTCQVSPDLDTLRDQIKPNATWADEHFEERVGEIPLNPPPSHQRWPYAQKNNAEFGGVTKFSHTYPERIWSKYGELDSESWRDKRELEGVRFKYGDFMDVVDLMEKEPFTRQAFLPIWFPEDTGVVHKERVPCTIGYHFIRRFDWIHVVYYIRSCDYFRHFRDDIYLCARKLLWLLGHLKERDQETWGHVKPGMLTMHICSLHAFKHEKVLLKAKKNF